MKKIIYLFLTILLLFVTVIIISAKIPVLKTTSLGAFSRLLLGTPLALQDMEDLEMQVLKKNPERLIKWGENLAEKYKIGKIADYKSPEKWVRGDVVIARSEIPGWVEKSWLEPQFNTFPVVSIKLNETRQPEYVYYQWYLKGIAISVSNEASINSLDFAWKVKKVSHRIYVFATEK